MSVDARAARHLPQRALSPLNGEKPLIHRAPSAGYYPHRRWRWVQLHCNFPHHREGVLRLLQVEDQREAVAAAIKDWKAAELEAALTAAEMCAGMMRVPEEWQAHPHAQALAMLLPLESTASAMRPPSPCPREIGRCPAFAPWISPGDRGARLRAHARRARRRRDAGHRRAPAPASRCLSRTWDAASLPPRSTFAWETTRSGCAG